MDKKNLMVFFLAIASVLLLANVVSAATSELATIDSVKVDDIYDSGNEDISVIAGETVTIKVAFTADEDASDVRVKAEVEGTKLDISDKTSYFDVEEGKRYSKTLQVKIPYELKDEVSDDLALEIKVWNGDYKTEHPEITLRVQRPTYNVDIMSIDSPDTVEAGEIVSVDVVIKNVGYNYLDDMYVTTRISALGLERKSYLGDVVAYECDDDDEEGCDEDDTDTLKARFYLQIPYDAESGIYTLEAEASNDDVTVSEVKQVIVENDFATGNVVATDMSKTFATGENAFYELLVVNPTNKLKVYRIVTESTGSLSTSASNSVIAVPAGSSKTLTVTANAVAQGNYEFDVNVFSGENLVNTVTLGANVEGSSVSNPVVILTIILAIIFLVLLVVLIVLIGKKSEKTEEFGESYY